jgi:hypothetical protein
MRDTIDLIREAGFPMAWISENDGGVIQWKDVKAFEALVRADEREAMLDLALLHAAPWHFQEAIRNRGNT